MIDTKLLRQKILDLAIRGKLVPQNPTDEPASELLKKIKAEKDALVKAGKIKKNKHESFIFRGDDNRYYEQIDGKTTDITEEIPFDIPENWTWCRFRSICSEINVGIVIQPTRYYTTPENGIPAFRNANIRPNKIDDSNWIYLNKAGINENPRCIVHTDDLLISRSGNAGICCVASQKYNGYGAVDILIATLLSPYSQPKYYSFCINSNNVHQVILQMNRGVALSHIGVNSLVDVLLPIPPLAEQKRIVSQIEALFAEVDKIDKDSADLESALTLAKQKVLDLAIRGKLVPQNPDDEPASELLKRIKAEKDALVKAGKIKKDKHESFIFKGDDNCYYEQLNSKTVDITTEIPFGLPESWHWCRLRSLGQIVGGGTPSTANQMFWNGSIPWLSPADLTGYTRMYITHGKKNITEEGLEKSSAVLMPAGSVLYSSRAPIGYVIISKNSISTNQGFKSLVPAIVGMSEFYYFALKARTADIKQRATGTTFKEISGNEFGDTIVPLPPIAEQQRIVQAIMQYNSILEAISE